MAVIELNNDNFDQTIRDNDMVILDFWAPWCGPCRQFAPTFEAVSENFNDVVFAKINTEDEQDLAMKFQIRSIPTLAVFREQVPVFLQPGSLSETDLKSLVEKAQALDMDAVRQEIAKKE